MKSLYKNVHQSSCMCRCAKQGAQVNPVKVERGTAPFRMEAGRWRGLAREKIYMHCSQGEVEHVYHWMMRFTAWTESRTLLIEKVNCMIDVSNFTDVRVADYVMDRACTDCQLMKSIKKMWNERFI